MNDPATYRGWLLVHKHAAIMAVVLTFAAGLMAGFAIGVFLLVK